MQKTSLPLDLRQAGTFNSFKAKLRCYDFSNYLTGIHLKQGFYSLL